MPTKDLPVKLSDSERLASGQALAGLVEERRVADDARKEAAKEARDRLDLLDTRIETTACVVRTGWEDRPVEVQHRSDHRRNVMETIRLDTLEVVDTRALAADERQARLRLADGDEGGAA